MWYLPYSGQIIATSAEVTPNGGLVRESPPNPLNSGLGIIVICPYHLIRLVYVVISKTAVAERPIAERLWVLPSRGKTGERVNEISSGFSMIFE